MSARIHPTAIVNPEAVIGDGTEIGPYAVIEGNVVIGHHAVIESGAKICWGSRLGDEVRVFSYAAVGGVPQDLKFHGEETILEVGDRTVIREFATLNRGTSASNKTVVGSDCLLMAYSHVAHDCIIGNHCILANSATLAGHIIIEDWVNVGGLVPIHQFVKIGRHAMIGGGWRVPKDVPPFVIAAEDPLRPMGINKIGLTRRGFSEETVTQLTKAYRILFRSKKDMKRALEDLDQEEYLGPEVDYLKEFIRTSERGVIL